MTTTVSTTVDSPAELGHVGLWVEDVAAMTGSYRDVIGLTVTDSGDGITFLSARPGVEHHELVLIARRPEHEGRQLVNQLSWRVGTAESLLAIYRRLCAVDTRIESTSSHGYALSVYFFDPEGNRSEIYWHTGWVVPQPYKVSVDFGQSFDALLDEAVRLLPDGVVVDLAAAGRRS